MRREPCACGGLVIAPDDDWVEIAFAVFRHNATDLHTAWRLGGWA